jgi:hypothetical protein
MEATSTTTQSGPASVATTHCEAWRDNDIERVRPLARLEKRVGASPVDQTEAGHGALLE